MLVVPILQSNTLFLKVSICQKPDTFCSVLTGRLFKLHAIQEKMPFQKSMILPLAKMNMFSRYRKDKLILRKFTTFKGGFYSKLVIIHALAN